MYISLSLNSTSGLELDTFLLKLFDSVSLNLSYKKFYQHLPVSVRNLESLIKMPAKFENLSCDCEKACRVGEKWFCTCAQKRTPLRVIHQGCQIMNKVHVS